MKSRCLSVPVSVAFALAFSLTLDTLAGPAISPGPDSPSPINFDANPSFDLGGGAGDPLFAPELLGLTNGAAGYDRVAAIAAFADVAKKAFPPSHEVFLAYCGNPGYALLPIAAPAAEPGGGLRSLTSAFRAGGLAANIVPARSASYDYSDGSQAIADSVLYELPRALVAISPLVLDLNGDVRLSASRGEWRPHPTQLTGPYAAFDMDGDGFVDVTEWIGAGDALLTTTLQPKSGRDLLGTAGGWKDGFEHLAVAFDLDHNGRVEGAELDGLYAWQDANGNGVADPSEVVPVRSLGITWISTTHSNYVASYGYAGVLSASTGTVWDWWPNYALANRRATLPSASGHPLLGQQAISALRQTLLAAEKKSPAPSASLPGPIHIPPTELAALGLDLPSFRLALLADAGHVLIGCDSLPGPPSQLRLVRVKLDALAPAGKKTPTPVLGFDFDHEFQLACDLAGRVALVLGDEGSRLALVDFDQQTVVPPGGLDLRSIGLRASGVVGYNGVFWFTAWQLDDQGAVLEERVWAITPFGFWGGLSFDTLRSQLGPLRQHYLTGPDSGFFVTPSPGGAGETLWAIDGSCSDTCRVAIAQADAFGGLSATAKGKVSVELHAASGQ